MAVLRLLLSSLPVDKVGPPRYTRLMRVVELRVLLALVLVLLGTMVIVGLNLGDDADTMTLQGQTRPLRSNHQEKPLSAVRLPSWALHPSRTDSETAPRLCASVIDLVCVLRC